jgi:hypothetical protein
VKSVIRPSKLRPTQPQEGGPTGRKTETTVSVMQVNRKGPFRCFLDRSIRRRTYV